MLATFLVTLMALWVATGNSLGNLPLYLRTAASIAGGFAGAMSGEQVGRYEYWYYAAIVTALLTVSLALGLRAARVEQTSVPGWSSWVTRGWC